MSRRLLYLSSTMLFFWSIYDGIISYLIPLFISDRGFSNTVVGVLIALSAVSGAFFDIILSKFVRTPFYLRFFFFLFAVCLLYPLILWSASGLLMFVLAMVLWGLYYDLVNFGILDLSPRVSRPDEHTKNISLIGVFKTVGYFIGPPLSAYLISIYTLRHFPIIAPYVFLIIAAVFFVLLFIVSPRAYLLATVTTPPRSVYWFRELLNWKKLGRILFPVLFFNTLFYIFEATFWTLGPIYSQQFPDSRHFSSLFMVVYILPSILAAGFAEKITQLFGKKRTAYVAFIISNLFLIPLGQVQNTLWILILVLISTIAGSLAWSAISGAFVDYLAESIHHDSDIIGLKDFSANLGYIIGPVMSGIISDLVGISYTFTILGIANILLVLFLFTITPKNIAIPNFKNFK